MTNVYDEIDLERARSALFAIDPGCPRDEWVKTAMGAKAAGLTCEDFIEWSETAGNFASESDCLSVWRSIREGGGIGPGTLFAMARAAGWQDPTRASRAPRFEPAGFPPQADDIRLESPAVMPAERTKIASEPLPKTAEGKRLSFDVEAAWQAAEPATAAHPYIVRKQGDPAGLKVYRGPARVAGQALDGALMVPSYDMTGRLQTVQFIPPDQGKKLNAPGRPVQGAFVVGRIAPPGTGQTLFIVEGIGAAWSCYQASNQPAVVCFGAGRMQAVAQAFKDRYPAARLVLVADAGKEAQCERIARELRAAWVEMPSGSPSNYDANDFAAEHGSYALTELLDDAKAPPTRFKLAERTASRMFFGEPPPVQWLVQGILPLGVSALLASPPNVGKSFLALELCAKVAGQRTGDLPAVALGGLVRAHGRAVFVSAEDDEPELHRRLWSLCGGDMPARLHLLSLPDVGHFGIIEPDAATGEFIPTRPWLDLADEIRALDDVRLVVLDTLQALTSGDTNTTAATQPLMNEAVALARATGACVLLIHHLAKGKTGEIRTSWDAMESIRGSGAIAGSVRAAYVLWPPSDGGRAVCETIGTEYQEGKVAFGIVAKRYGDASRERSVFVRDETGILRDRTDTFNAMAGGDKDTLRAELLAAIRKAWAAGQAYAASAAGHNGLHARRFELAEAFHEKPRPWFEEQAGKLLSDGDIKRMAYRGGFRLVPAEAETAVPGDAPEEGLEGAEQAETVGPKAPEHPW